MRIYKLFYKPIEKFYSFVLTFPDYNERILVCQL